MQDEIKYVIIGKISSTHGNKGMLKVKPLTDFPERFQKMGKVLLFKNSTKKCLHVRHVFYHKNSVILQFSEINNMNEAEEICGGLLKVCREDLVELPEGRYYVFDIVGCNVYDIHGESLGKIKDIIKTGSNDVYVVDKKEKKPLLIPALKSVVKSIELQQKKVEVDLPEGLED
ncbi:MAG: ribosome maturation factor RimM [Clostridiales bacterium]|nr:ribosome maturation factor RimM [Clostridiales bacterium]MCF8022609.1 ribosome maturation factor RimM [Clostridiales bacterium]